MVFHVKRVPALAVHLRLPFGEGLFELHKVKRTLEKVGDEAVSLHVGKVYHHVEHLVLDLRLHARPLADGEAVVKIKHVALELGKIVVDLRQIGVILHARCRRELYLCARQTVGLGDVGYNVLAEAVNAHVEPEAHYILDLFAHLGV